MGKRLAGTFSFPGKNHLPCTHLAGSGVAAREKCDFFFGGARSGVCSNDLRHHEFGIATPSLPV